MSVLLRDDFLDPRPPGRALGPPAGGDPARGGIDREGNLSVDGGALRIRPPLVEGWGRTCLAYGPFPNQPGLAVSFFVLNGHNTSQAETMSDTLRSRVGRWAKGSGSAPVHRRLRRWLASGRVRRVLRQVRWWQRIAVGSGRVKPMDENLAIGLYPAPTCDPLQAGTGFVMHADGPRNGELWAGASGTWAPVLDSVQNLPIRYVLVVRQRDVVLLASSLPAARGPAAHPRLRPLAAVARPGGAELYASLHQGTLGQIGFRADTRVYSVRVAALDGAEGAFAWASVADHELAGVSLAGRRAVVGGEWSSRGAVLVLEPSEQPGFVRIVLDASALAPDGVSVAWRCAVDGCRLELRILPVGAELFLVERGARESIARQEWVNPPGELQVLDDSRILSIVSDGRLLFDRRFSIPAAAGATAVGLVTEDGIAPAGLRSLEALPLELSAPSALLAGEPWSPEAGSTLWTDPLAGEPGDLAGRPVMDGRRTWQRLLGCGRLEIEAAGGARWRASTGEPLPERTVYAFDWDDEEFVEMEVTLTPPGTRRGEREHGTAGFCLWQDRDNYLLINTWLDDCYDGASLSSFFSIDGFEDIYDAIWTNVGDRIVWGRPLRLKVVSDGLHYLVSIDGEPVLYRALSDVYPGCGGLRIRKVGLLGNWEWGADTGSRFADLRVATRGGARPAR